MCGQNTTTPASATPAETHPAAKRRRSLNTMRSIIGPKSPSRCLIPIEYAGEPGFVQRNGTIRNRLISPLPPVAPQTPPESESAPAHALQTSPQTSATSPSRSAHSSPEPRWNPSGTCCHRTASLNRPPLPPSNTPRSYPTDSDGTPRIHPAARTLHTPYPAPPTPPAALHATAA